MATPFARIMDNARVHLPGAFDNAIQLELFNVCRDFFMLSNTWREKVPFSVDAGESTADIVPFAGRIVRLIGVWKDDLGVRGATMPAIGTIRLSSPVNVDTSYSAEVVLTVTDPVARDAYPIIPFELVDRYGDELLDGVLARMMSQPSKPYSNTVLAQYHLMRYKGGAARARNAVNAENSLGAQRWTYPQDFANR